MTTALIVVSGSGVPDLLDSFAYAARLARFVTTPGGEDDLMG